MSRYPAGPRDCCFGFMLARRLRRTPLEFITEIGREYGDMAYFRMGPIRVYMINDPQLIREVLVTKHKSFRRPRMLVRPLAKIDGNGLVLSEGDFWLRQRRLVQPAFATKRFEQYAQVIVQYTERMLAGWSARPSLDVADEMTRLTLAIIAKTLFDVELADQAAQLGEAVRVVSESYVREAASPLPLPDWLPTPGKRRKRQAIRRLDHLVWKIIRERRASGQDHGDLLSMLLMAVDHEGDGRGMTDRQARDEAMTLFNAGHDSTAAALAWIWYLVAGHPQVEAHMVDEIDQVLAGQRANFSDVPRLPYVEMVVKEALRLYPPTWAMFPREATTVVEVGGYTIARRSWVYVFPYVTHRDPRYFENPEKFDPERFASGRVDKIPQFAYFPFGGGPRVCIGNTFAMMEMILIVAGVLQKFRLKLSADQGAVEPEPLIAIRPRGGLRLAISPRPEWAVASTT